MWLKSCGSIVSACGFEVNLTEFVDLQELIDEATAGPDQALQEEEQLRKGREADEEQNRQTALEVHAQSG